MIEREIHRHQTHVEDARKSGRWTPGRKASLLALVGAGVITEAQALKRYGFTREELRSLDNRRARFGLEGLMLTHLQVAR